MSVVENEVELTWLWGKPRWWTVTESKSREVIRIEHTANDQLLVLYVVLPVGNFTYPPLVVAAIRAGNFKDIEERSGQVIICTDPRDGSWTEEGLKCESIFVGTHHPFVKAKERTNA